MVWPRCLIRNLVPFILYLLRYFMFAAKTHEEPTGCL